MTSDELKTTLKQNHENLKALLDALDADYEMPNDPEKDATIQAAFTPGQSKVSKDADMTDEELAVWLFEENAKAIAAAAESAGVSKQLIDTSATDPLKKYSVLFNPNENARGSEQGH
jgi:DsbC/DsbD-like thiol-disulfide interchange protein